MPVPLIARVVTGVGLAVACTLVLAWWVTQPGDSASTVLAAVDPPSDLSAVPDTASGPIRRAWPDTLDAVSAPVWLVYIAASAPELPARLAPVFELTGPEGEDVGLVRPPSVIQDPRHSAWLGVGVVVPSVDLGAWSPGFRAQVIRVLDALSVPRTVGADQIVVLGAPEGWRGAVDRLCRWRRR